MGVRAGTGGAGLGVQFLPPVWFGDGSGGGEGDTQTRPRSAQLPCLGRTRLQFQSKIIFGEMLLTF